MTHTRETVSPRTAAGTRGRGLLRAVQASAALSVLSIAWQFVTAGQILPRGGPAELHTNGAIVLHVMTGLMAIATILYARSRRGPWWPAVLAVIVFVLTFVQAWFGGYTTLAIHVPGALVCTIGTVWLAAWAFTHAGRR
jgi:hypothetical protein